jgi:hypothetical protein
MASFSIWHWIILFLVAYIVVAPCWRIAKKAGFAGSWSLLMLVPLLNLVVIWVFALSRWPAQNR